MKHNQTETFSHAQRSVQICLVTSTGGHLEQMLRLKDFYSAHNHFFVLPEDEKSGGIVPEEEVIRIPNVNEGKGVRNPILLLRAILHSLILLRRTKPDLILSTGSGIAFPVFVAGAILRTPRVYIESFARVSRPSRSGRACYPLSSLFLIQHPALARHYSRGVYCGPLYGAL